MSIEARVRAALLPIVPVVEPNQYDGTDTVYITFRYDEIGVLFAEGEAQAVRSLLSVSLHMPIRPTAAGESTNPNTLTRRIKAALVGIGCTTPDIVDASDEGGRIFVFECEATDNGAA